MSSTAMPLNSSIVLVMLIAFKQNAVRQFAEFTEKNAPLLKRYNISLLKTIDIGIKGQLLGENKMPQPNIINIYHIPSMDLFMDYMADDEYKAASLLRSEATETVQGYFTREQPLPEPFYSDSPATQRLYIVGFAHFKNQNEIGLEAFNRQAIATGLFKKHGMHIEHQLSPFKVVTVVGATEIISPDRIQVFFVDHPDNIKNYVSDPVYKELSPIRDETLDKYDFFAGSLRQE